MSASPNTRTQRKIFPRKHKSKRSLVFMSEAWLLSSICQEFCAVNLGCEAEVCWQGCETRLILPLLESKSKAGGWRRRPGKTSRAPLSPPHRDQETQAGIGSRLETGYLTIHIQRSCHLCVRKTGYLLHQGLRQISTLIFTDINWLWEKWINEGCKNGKDFWVVEMALKYRVLNYC